MSDNVTDGSRKDFHDWFLQNRLPDYLERYLEKYNVPVLDAEGFSNDEDIQALFFNYFRAVPLREIEIPDIWDQRKMQDLKLWANDDTLMRTPIDSFGPRGFFATFDPPYMGRMLSKENWNSPPRYVITNGIHRVNFAKMNNIQYILAEIKEGFEIRKEEMGAPINRRIEMKRVSCNLCKKEILKDLFFHHLNGIHGNWMDRFYVNL